ncbi:hypothetical protein C1H46_032121 [Malus baccata]|uniref:Uncharacterized protein n=1 Tax=Malus baccata TaxID=106549 RepID=A0A540L780_MALBA|nr:hypothetical protein C1H46_032120 [Malus baccata]TQD82325.1 hypothetical protein C1H46_032121 [Malus baccata]
MGSASYLARPSAHQSSSRISIDLLPHPTYQQKHGSVDTVLVRCLGPGGDQLRGGIGGGVRGRPLRFKRKIGNRAVTIGREFILLDWEWWDDELVVSFGPE